jgi:hypothetical protein
MSLAPVVLFVYNRPDHTKQTLEALVKNDLANESDLFVFCDGPKENADVETLEAIRNVRDLVKSRRWCKSVKIIESQRNKGLADSIVEGVTKIINQFGKIIVLEDDIITSKGFLKYMNEALNLYEQEDKVMHISSYLPYTNSIKTLPETFFLPFMSCWGWATWKRAWDKANWDSNYLYQQIKEPKVLYTFNLDGVLNFHEQLENNISGSIKTWAIKWYTSIFLNNGLCLYPKISLTINIGLDGSGENCHAQDEEVIFDMNHRVEVKYKPLKELNIGKHYLKRYYRYGKDSSLQRRVRMAYLHYRYQFIKLVKGI